MKINPFHLAIPVYDLVAARHFYGQVFGCAEGRSAPEWVDFDFFGHQLVIHQHPKTASQDHAHTNAVDGHDVQAVSAAMADVRAGLAAADLDRTGVALDRAGLSWLRPRLRA